MNLRLFLFSTFLCLFPLLLSASDLSRKERNKTELLLKDVSLALFEYAGKNKETFPEGIDQLVEYTKKKPKLAAFLKNENYSYLGSSMKVYELKEDTVVSTFTFPGHGKLTLLGYGEVKWEKQK